MKPQFSKISCLLAVLGLLASVPALADAAREQELAELRGRIANLKASIDRTTRKRSEAQSQVQAAEQQISQANRRLRDLAGQRKAGQARRTRLSGERSELAGKVARERDALAGQVRAAYLAGREERLKLLLNQEDPARLGRMMVYYDYFNRMRAETIGKVSSQIEQLQALDAQLAAQVTELEGLERERAAELKRMEAARDQRRQAVSRLDAELARQGDQVARLEEQARVLEKLMEELRAVLKDFPTRAQEPFARLRGKLAWPVSGRLLADYGQPRAGNRIKWRGVLVGTDRGAEVRAIYHGRVAYADWLPGMGLLVILDHGDDYMSLYGHNDTLYVAAGDWVAPGDLLSSVGDSGGRNETALYFEIRRGKRPESPHRWFARPLGRR